jgi:hypothetical protein
MEEPAAEPTTVWVVSSDYGLNGFEVHAVYDVEPAAKLVKDFAQANRHVTGYGGTEVQAFTITEVTT